MKNRLGLLATALVVFCSSAPGESSPHLTRFALVDQGGELVSERQLEGHVWIADFVYTSCESACPLVTSRLVALQHRLPDPALRFVSFSVDPETDTPTRLKEYADRWHATERRWHLLSTKRAALSKLISSLALPLDAGPREILHSDRFFLFDERGHLFGDYESSDDRAMARLVGDAARLSQRAPALAATGVGRELFVSLGCAGCHTDPQLAPALTDLFGSHVMVERGPSLLADDAYLRESIATPDAKIVAGYAASMPAYGALLSAVQLDSLVEYVRSLHAESSAASHSLNSRSAEKDPVCGMTTRVTDQTPTVAYEGQSYHFCSASCAARFRADPLKYLEMP